MNCRRIPLLFLGFFMLLPSWACAAELQALAVHHADASTYIPTPGPIAGSVVRPAYIQAPAIRRLPPKWKPYRQSENCLILAGWKALCWKETERIPNYPSHKDQ